MKSQCKWKTKYQEKWHTPRHLMKHKKSMKRFCSPFIPIQQLVIYFKVSVTRDFLFIKHTRSKSLAMAHSRSSVLKTYVRIPYIHRAYMCAFESRSFSTCKKLFMFHYKQHCFAYKHMYTISCTHENVHTELHWTFIIFTFNL